jgi:hypothetical protein
MALALSSLLESHGLRLEVVGGGWAVHHGSSVHGLASLPLEGISGPDERAELLALAAGIEAAAKVPGAVESTSLLDGTANLLPRVERRRFLLGYDAVLAGRDAGDGERLLSRDLGCGLVVLYVRDAGWRFHYVVQGQLAQWGTDPAQLHEAARSNLYHRAALDPDAHQVAIADGYDAARLLIAGDVFFTLGSRTAGLMVALPHRDQLLVGEEATSDAVLQGFHGAAYPLASAPMVWRGGTLSALSGAN